MSQILCDSDGLSTNDSFPAGGVVEGKLQPPGITMSLACQIAGCKGVVPDALVGEVFCPLHFTVSVEQKCADLRRETVGGAPDEGRRAEIARYLGEAGRTLASVATGDHRLPDELKARILNTFLTLMNLRENMERAAARQKPKSDGASRTAKV